MDSIEKNFSKHGEEGGHGFVGAKVPLKTVREQFKISEDQRIKEIKRLWIIKMDKSEFMDSMPRRLEEVILRQGVSTKY
jgi:hypothetical protein